MSKTNPQESAATAKFVIARKSPQIVDDTSKIVDIVKANPAYATQPLVQGAVTDWSTAATNVSKNDGKIKAARVALVALMADRHATVATWKRTTKFMLAVIDQVSAGSAKSIKDWGFDITTRAVPPATPSNDPPVNVRLTYSKALVPTIRWNSVLGHRGYNLQIGDGSPAGGWGAIIQVAQAHYKPVGLAPGQTISVRVAVQRKNGVSPYSAVVTFVIR